MRHQIVRKLIFGMAISLSSRLTPQDFSASRASRSHTAQLVAIARISSCKDSVGDMRFAFARGRAARHASDVQIAGAERVFLDELAPRLDLIAHQLANISSASSCDPICTFSSERVSGFIVVAHNCSGFISPSPL